MTIDRIDYYYDKALEAYCQLHTVSPDKLTDEQLEEIHYYAGNHIGFFITWVKKNDFIQEAIRTRKPTVLTVWMTVRKYFNYM